MEETLQMLDGGYATTITGLRQDSQGYIQMTTASFIYQIVMHREVVARPQQSCNHPQ